MNPSATPAKAATDASTAEITEICRGVAPTSRIAAKRSSRLAADSRLAVDIKMSTGNNKATAPMARIHCRAVALPAPLLQALQLAGVCWMLRTSAAPGTCESCCGSWPITMISELGDGRPAVPMVPV